MATYLNAFPVTAVQTAVDLLHGGAESVDAGLGEDEGVLLLGVVLERRLSRPGTRAVVQEVVDHLVEGADPAPDFPGRTRRYARSRSGQDGRSPEQLPGLSADHGPVPLFIQGPAPEALLGKLAGDGPLHRLHEGPHEGRVPGQDRRPVGAGQVEVAQDEGRTEPLLTDGGRTGSPGLGAVQDVVVQKGGFVDHLDGQPTHPESVVDRASKFGGEERPGHRRPEKLALQRRHRDAIPFQHAGRPGEGIADGGGGPAHRIEGAWGHGVDSARTASPSSEAPSRTARAPPVPENARWTPHATARAPMVAATAPQSPAAVTIPRGMRMTAR